MKNLAFLLLAVLFCSDPTVAENDGYTWLRDMTSRDASTRKTAAERLIRAADPALVPGMVDTFFYMPRNARDEMRKVLKHVAGEDVGEGYYEWVEYLGRRSDLKPAPGYLKYKASLLSRIDPRYPEILFEGVPVKIRPEEIVWGGATLDGIPPIDQPVIVPATQAKFQESERVFGISIKGEHRAYPLRYLSWHEMLNDRIQDEPFTISY